MWELKKMYDKDVFPDDENSLGYGVDMYQESINKYFKEYLVNFEYFKHLMKIYGFDVLTKNELADMGFKNSIGGFKELFTMMNEDITNNDIKKNDVGAALKMSSDEKSVSFLNNYFIFQKKRDVDAKNIYNMHVNADIHAKIEEEQDEEGKEDSPVKIPIRRKVKKLKTKFKLPK